MGGKRKANKQTGGININSSEVRVGGDMVGRNKVISTQANFSKIYEEIEARPDVPDTDKSEIRQTVEKIQAEAEKGERADTAKVERWLRLLAGMADDIFQVTVATLTNPAAGFAKAIQLIAKRAKQENN